MGKKDEDVLRHTRQRPLWRIACWRAMGRPLSRLLHMSYETDGWESAGQSVALHRLKTGIALAEAVAFISSTAERVFRTLRLD